MEPLIIQIDLDHQTPVYRQIVDAIRALAVEARLKPGDRLPTVRDLAADLGVHHNTVAQAYRELADEGWLELGRRRGATITSRQRPSPSPETRTSFAQRLRELIAKARAEGLTENDITSIMAHARPERRLRK